MFGSSRSSAAGALEALAARVDASNADTVRDDLLAVSGVLASSASLRGMLADSGSDAGSRQALVRSLLAGKVGDTALEVVADAVERRWTSGTALVDALEALGFEAGLIGAELDGRLDTVEDELFRVDRLVANDDHLRFTLSDPGIPDAVKGSIFADFLGGKADPTTVALVTPLAAHPRGRSLESALADLVTQSARRRQRLLARVTVAADLTAAQADRLAAALGQVYGQPVDLQVDVDPDVLGGVVVKIGDEVIDGSIAHRLAAARRRLAH
jgi:F-type H+-transporting ATPase subunit delta